MTAEIAVLNRTAVALAAGSATTIVSSRYGAKANNNADKLFHLCGTQPVGLMVFGNAEFMDIPLEPIVKGFRASAHGVPARRQLEDYASAF